MMSKTLTVQTYVIQLKVGGFIASLLSAGMPSLATVPKATSFNVLPSNPEPTLVSLLKGLQNLVYFLGSFGKSLF